MILFFNFYNRRQKQKEEIKSMPDVYRYSIDRINQIVDKAIKNKIPMVALFPKLKNKLKIILLQKQ